MGRYLDAQGKLPFPWMDGYTDMAKMVQLWDIALAEAVKAKGNVVQFWSGENEANAGFVANGATVGQCWDSTGFNLRNDGYGYVADTKQRTDRGMATGLDLDAVARIDEENGNICVASPRDHVPRVLLVAR